MNASADKLGGLVLEVFRLNGCLIAAGDDKVAPFGLSSARWQILGAAIRTSEPRTVSQLARETGASRQAVQRLTNVLVDGGLLEMTENPQDKRAQRVEVTEKGRSVYSRANRVRQIWLGDIAECLGEDEIEHALRLLERLRSLLSYVD
ncbi:MarR family winged helix-turn-helix transcriptional regulator [Qingshengfaniella alkalisoli]|uniref:MarR family transcriptional regulator n=1 Tax=Qingshengfaniella alkalisoli TaxID=2599296 RepID=A0A5B8IUG3_9RHOB|nr:MarR family transcriptional regulator [Qingshengfaniella alkalisoli]QDY69294.1 MarR family transcriptional regulator [Qingshengfaniella alkalisoli]